MWAFLASFLSNRAALDLVNRHLLRGRRWTRRERSIFALCSLCLLISLHFGGDPSVAELWLSLQRA